MARPFCCLRYVEFLIRGRLNQDVLRFFGRRHDVSYFFNRLSFNEFTVFFGLDFEVKVVELGMVEKRRFFRPNKKENIFEKLGLIFEEYQQGKDEVFAVEIDYGLDSGVDIFRLEGVRGFPQGGELGKDLSEGSIIIELGSILLFRFFVEGVFWNVNQPVAKLNLSIQKDYVLGVDLTMDDVFRVEVIDTLEERGECIDKLIFSKKLLIEGSFAVLQFSYHV
jgi:hypothetical protein